MVYLPHLQTPGPLAGAKIAVRTVANPEKMAELLWNEVKSETPHLQEGGTTTQARLVDGTLAADRMLAQLSGFFAFTAAALVCMGLYGLTAYEVSRRTSEIGLRMALGAQRSTVVRMILGRSMILVAIGTLVGLSAGVGLGRMVQNLLFGIRGTDPVTMLLSAGVLLTASASAAFWAARRAASLDPIASLRHE